MQIWIINPYDNLPSEGKPQRFWTLAATLAEQGHEVVWWSSDWSHRRKARREAPGQGTEDRGQRTEDPSKILYSSKSDGGRIPHLSCVADRASTDPVSQIPNPASHISNPASLPFTLRLVSTPAYEKNISFARIWNHWKFGRNFYEEACAAINSGELAKPDVVPVSMPPMEGPIAALRLRKRYGCRVVTDIMDAWPDTWLQALSGPPRPSGTPQVVGAWAGAKLAITRLFLSPYYWMLRRACRESDAVCAQSETFANFARQHGASGEIHVCYLGAEPSHRSGASERRSGGPPILSEQEGSTAGALLSASKSVATGQPKTGQPETGKPETDQPRPPLRLLYLGAMGRSYDLETLVSACCGLREAGHSLELHFAGEGEKMAQLQAMTAEWAEGTVHFHGFLQEASLAELLQMCDVGIVPMFPESGVAVPYKIGDYLAAGLPVVNSLPGELQGLLVAHDCGRMYEAGSVESMERALNYYLKLPEEEWCGEKVRAHALFASHFDRTQSYPQFAQWLVEGWKSRPGI